MPAEIRRLYRIPMDWIGTALHAADAADEAMPYTVECRQMKPLTLSIPVTPPTCVNCQMIN